MYNVPFLGLFWTPQPTLIWDVINGRSLVDMVEIFLRSPNVNEGLFFVLAMCTYYRDSLTGGAGGRGVPTLRILIDQSTLFQLVEKDYASQLTTNIPPPGPPPLQIFRPSAIPGTHIKKRIPIRSLIYTKSNSH